MNLKTDYKNDKFSGKRKYRLSENSDGTISLDDVTAYVEVGDIFSSDDINSTNEAINNISNSDNKFRLEVQEKFKTVDDNFGGLNNEIKQIRNEIAQIDDNTTLKIPAANWSSNSPYVQTVSFPGLTQNIRPVYGLELGGTLNSTTVEAQEKSWGYIDRIASGNGMITLYCYRKKPTVDLVLIAKRIKNG